ncbi:hypothetical protein MRS44_016248 [Fusarium solani]|jgi:ankyrin repeat protein|uniref:F-box domain-containing protein n=1 Tax=Fusarium solani TaxID=169388 RepID=A0A9P9GB02_FUSSL|nr:uncharacterized protein B0J15DRAFT_504330 [Fusarium solani]KAH7234427.1 hypothetical protein B0J15DRAFT_504330 [Fusarium solani]KAJ3456225.1 hypothetical protein MRS44_016248 [Fusarium solani]KAJ4214332.1 hypothetical protein NW759_010350 [Fusarium solani]
MPSHIESLPNELFEPILLDLSLLDVAHLNQSSKPLNKSLDGYLLRLPTATSRLMRWGCQNGERWAIEKALAHGADITLVEVGPIVSSTICLAARRHQYETIKFLLESGARLNPSGVDHRQERALKRRLFDPRNPKLLRLFLELRAGDQIPNLQEGLDDALLKCVRLGLDHEICQQWMDLGANPASLPGKNDDPQSPFSMAILSGSLPLAQLLLPPDANLGIPYDTLLFELPRFAYADLHPWHSIPILAAARSMATTGKTDMMEALLDMGGNINLSVKCHLSAFGLPKHDPHPVNPLLTYVLSLDTNQDLGAMKVTPAQGIKYLLEKGAKLDKPRPKGDDHDSYGPYGSHSSVVFPLISLLWEKHKGLKCLLSDEMFAAFKVLIENGGAKDAVSTFIVPFDPGYYRGPYRRRVYGHRQTGDGKDPLTDDEYRVLMERWGVLLDLILRDENFEISLLVEINDLFLDFIKGVFSTTLHLTIDVTEESPTNDLYEFIDESHPTTIQKLVEKGASLDRKSAMGPSYADALKRGGSTLLKDIFEQADISRDNYYLPQWPPWSRLDNNLQAARQRSFIAMLVAMGARPFLNTPEPERHSPSAYKKLRAAFMGEIVEAEKLLWNPRCGFLWDGSWEESDTDMNDG